MPIIDPSQDYDIIHEIEFDSAAGGTVNVRFYLGSGTVALNNCYYREGTSGSWTSKNVSGSNNTISSGSKVLQVGYDWAKLGNNYTTISFQGSIADIEEIRIRQKATLSGVMGDYFMYQHAHDCSSLKSLEVPDTSGVTSVGSYFMAQYASSCSSLTKLEAPNASGVTSVGTYFMNAYAYGCSSLAKLEAPDISGVTSVGSSFMQSYATSCTSLTSLDIPDTSGVTSVGSSFMRSYAYGCSSLTSLGIPDTSGAISVDSYFMDTYASNCSSLEMLILPKIGWFETNNVNWSVPSGRLGILEGIVTDEDSLQDWKDSTQSGNTLYTNYIRDAGLVTLKVIGGALKVWDGSAWASGVVKVWNGSSWVAKPMKYYNEGVWKTVS